MEIENTALIHGSTEVLRSSTRNYKQNTPSDSYRVKLFDPKQLIWFTPLQNRLQVLKRDTSGIVEH